MNLNQTKLLSLSILLTGALHQKLMEVSAQEIMDSTKETTVSAETVQSTETTESTESVAPIEEIVTNDTVNETIVTLDDVEAELGNSILEQVNDLRELNGLDRLEKNEQLEKSAQELVELRPISEEFTDQYGSTHALDNKIAQTNGYNSKYIPANHVYSEVKISDIQGKSLQEIASDFVNKWYLDMSNPDLAHRKQMLTKGWEETGVGVKITPKLMLGEFKNEHIKSKFGETIFNNNTLELLDGFEIHATQYFGSEANYVDYSTPNETLSLPNYSKFVMSQIDKEEYNPNTNQKVKLDSSKAIEEIRRQEKINNTNTFYYNSVNFKNSSSNSDIPEEIILNQLFSTKASFDRTKIEKDLDKRIKDKILDELKVINNEDKQVLNLVKGDKLIGFWNIIKEDNQLKLFNFEVPAISDSIKGNEQSITKENIFETEEEAVEFAEEKIKNMPNYYPVLVKMKDEKYSIWFSEKKIMTEEMKLLYENALLTQNSINDFIYDLKQIYKDVNVEIVKTGKKSKEMVAGEYPDLYSIKILDTTPVEYGNVGLAELLEDNDVLYPIEWSGLRNEGGFPYSDRESSDYYDLELYERIDSNYDTKFFGERGDGGSPSTMKIPKLSYLLLNSDKFVKNPNPETIHPHGYTELNFGYGFLPEVYMFKTPEGFDPGKNMENFDELRDYYATLPKNYLYHINKGIVTDSKYNQQLLYNMMVEAPIGEIDNDRFYLEKVNIYAYQTIEDVIKDIDSYGYKRGGVNHFGYDLYKLGNMQIVQYVNLFNIPKNEKIFYSLEEAQTAAKEHINNNPGLYYDLFKVENAYIIQYGETRLQTRWNPDEITFDSKDNANTFAQYVSTLVKKYDYEVVPGRNGFYRIKTNNIIFFDDQEGLCLIPEYIGSGNSGILGQNATFEDLNLTNIYSHISGKPSKPTPTPPKVEESKPSKPVPSKPKPTQPKVEENKPSKPIPEKPKPVQPKPEESKPAQPKSPVSTTDKEDKPEVIKPIKDLPGKESVFVPTVYAVSSNGTSVTETTIEAEKSEAERRVRAMPAEVTLSNLLNVMIQDLFKETDLSIEKIMQQFDLMYHIEFMFKDISKQDLEEPTKVEVVLGDTEDVERVVQYDSKNDKIVNELAYIIEERPVDQVKQEFPEFDFSKISGNMVRVVVFEVSESGDYGINFK